MPIQDFAVDLGVGLLNALAPLGEWVSDVFAFERLLTRHGWRTPDNQDYFAQVQQVFAFINDIPTLVDALADIQATTDPSPADVETAVKAAIDVVDALHTLLASAPPSGLPFPLASSAFWTTFPQDLIDTQFAFYLRARRPGVFAVLTLFGVLGEEAIADDPANGRSAHTEIRIDWSQLGGLLTNPRQSMQTLYGWGGTFQYAQLLKRLEQSLLAFLIPSNLEIPPQAATAAYYDAANPALPSVRRLRLPLFRDVSEGGLQSETGIHLLPIPASGDTLGPPAGVVISPYFVGDAVDTISLGGLFSLQLDAAFAVDDPVGIEFRPGSVAFSASISGTTVDLKITLQATPEQPFILIGSEDGSRLEAKDASVSLEVSGPITDPDLKLSLGTTELHGHVELDGGDSFISQSFNSQPIDAKAAVTVAWSAKNGLTFQGSGGLQLTIPTDLTLGPVDIESLGFALSSQNGGTTGALTVSASLELGPVEVSVQGIGVSLTGTQLGSTGRRGSFGDLDLAFGFQPPVGLGIAIDAGSVHGGGFISIDQKNNRYFGGLQLSIYDISVTAFGLLETPPGAGYSFVIVISAQFTPIQLGFGFTLIGVGGMVGINRSIDTNALASLVRAGQSEELLFPKNVISDAPTIVKDLTTVFPATQGKYVFGPLGKLGWGTPTLITGEIGIILEYPALVVVLLGEVKCLLPKPDQALVKLNLSIDGVLDFPNKTFSMDADLHDSVINGFPVSGQMAMRVSWGDQPNFVFSIGGFHPAYTPPPNFPKLQPMTLDLGSHGPAKISVSGFFAVTSNTVQVGGSATLHAGGSGITLDASVSVKALFVFQPFSFEADIDASVKISFHGYGPSVHLSGQLDGPSPWHIKGEVCVSIIWWDACLGFDVTFGGNTQITQPSIDPWLGAPSTDPTADIIGLQRALSDPGNWSGALVPGTVSSVARAQGTDTLVDPVGGLTVRQKTAPVETPNPLTKFGVAKTTTPIKFSSVQATLGTALNTVSLTAVQAVKEDFAPAQFFDMDDGKKLSSPGFEQYQAGYLFATADGKNAQGGSSVTFQPVTRTLVINSDGTDTEIDDNYKPTDPQVTAFNKQSAIAKGGLAQAGTRRFVNRAFTQSFSQTLPTFVITDSTTMAVPTTGPVPVPVPAAAVRSATLIALDTFRGQNVELALSVQVTALHDLPPTV